MCGSWYREGKVVSDKQPQLHNGTIWKSWHDRVALQDMVIQPDDDLPFLASKELRILFCTPLCM